MMTYGNMMVGNGFFPSLFGIVVLIDLILVGIFLWKKIQGR